MINPELQKKIARILGNHPVLFAYLYGSHANGTARAESDLDIGIYLEPALENRSMDIELALALEIDVLLDPPVQSDVRAINRMPLTLLGVIINHGQLLYSRNEEARINFEVGVRIAYFDFLPVIRRYRKAYLADARE